MPRFTRHTSPNQGTSASTARLLQRAATRRTGFGGTLPASWFRRPAIWSVIVLTLTAVGFWVGQGASATWSSTPTSADWVPGGSDTNWLTGIGTFPGATSGTTNGDTATFTGTSTQLNIAINSPTLNVKSITFGTTGALAAYTVGTTGGNSLFLTNNGAISIASAASGANITNAVNAPLVLEPASAVTAGTYSFSSASGTTSHPLVIGGTIAGGTTTQGVALTMQGGNAGANAINGIISDGGAAGGVSLIKEGSGTWTLSGNNSFTAGVTINTGTLKAGNATGLGQPASAKLTFGVSATGKFQLNGNNVTVSRLNTNAVAGTPSIESGSSSAGTDTLTVNTANTDIFGGVLQNGSTRLLALTKSGAGTLSLSGVNTSTGATTVNSGKLLVTGSTASGSAVAVNSGGTLGGTGTVAGSITVNSGGTVAPGNSAGILNTGNVTFTSGSNYNIEIGGTTVGTQYDQLNVTGTVALGSATLNLSSLSFTPVAGNSFTIINNDASEAVSGVFTMGTGGTDANGGMLAEGDTITNFLGSGLGATITYAGGSNNNDVILTVQATPAISIDDNSQAEGNGPGSTTRTFTVSRDAGALISTVNYATTAGTATQGPCSTTGNDYESTSGQLTFNSGETNKTILVPVCGDTTAEPDETYTVNLSTATNATISDATGDGTIVNDDGSATYTWAPTSVTALATCGINPVTTNAWICPGNWTPLRPTAASTTTNDILVFNGSVTPAPTIFKAPTQTIAAWQFINGINQAKFEADGPVTLTINGDTGSDLSIAAGSAVTLQGTNAITIAVTAAGTEGNIAGNLVFQGAAHKLTGANADEIIFQNGSFFTTTTGFSGHPFGSGTLHSVSLGGGSNSFFGAGLDPFGGAGNEVAYFGLLPISNQEFSAATAFDSNGHNYGNLTLTGNQTFTGSGSGQLSVFGNFVLQSGSTLTLSSTAGGDLNVIGNLADNNTSPTAFTANGRTVKFQGAGATQTISKPGNLSFDDVIISKTGGSVVSSGSLIINGALLFNGTTDVLDITPATLQLKGTVGGTNTAGGLKGQSPGSNLIIGGMGALGTLRFVSGGEFLTSLTVNRTSSGSVTLGTNLNIGDAFTGGVNLTNGIVDMGAFTLFLAETPSMNPTNGYVVGSVKKTFGGTGVFTYAVGTANGYSPVGLNVTGNTFPASLMVNAAQGPHPNITGANALQRYWTLTETGDLQADLTFNWRGGAPTSGDVVGTESSYKIFRYNGTFTQFEPSSPIDTVDHKATLNGVSEFSDWTLAEAAAVQEGSLAYFDGASSNVTEGNAGPTLKNVCVTRSGGTDGAVSVAYATSDGTAEDDTPVSEDNDYVATAGTLNWANGQGGDQCFNVTINSDTSNEPTETINITLSSATGGVTIAQSGHIINVVNDDGPGAALDFDGTDDYVTVPSHTTLHPTAAITIEAWVKPAASQVYPYARIADNDSVQLLVTSSTNFRFQVLTATGQGSVDASFTPGNWYHVAATYDGAMMRIYVDGALISSAPLMGAIVSNSQPLLLGFGYDPQYGKFQIDDFRLWDRALCEAEIDAQMSCELAGTEPGLVAYYKFNQGIADGNNAGVTTLIDSATTLGGANDGTLTNFALSGSASNWVAPGGVTTGTSCAAYLAPEIDVLGGSGPTSIPDGDITPSATDGTDFDNVTMGSSVSHPFTIANTGSAGLTLMGIPFVQITGAGASQFNVSPQPSSPIAASGTTNFSITFQPTGAGVATATVHIVNTDCDEGDYDFVIQGTGTAPSGETDVVVSGGNLVITDANGGTTADTLTISLNGANIRITDPNNTLTCGAGMTTVNANTCEVAAGDVTGDIQVDTQGANDTLTLNLGSGDLIPAGGVRYAGGGQTSTPGDKLVVTGGAQGTVTYNYTNPNDGNIVMTAYGTVTYTGLEPITNDGTATDIVFNLPATANAAILGNNGTTGDGISRLSGATFEVTDFSNPTGSVTINRGDAADTLTFNGTPDLDASLTIGSGANPFSSIGLTGPLALAANKNLAAYATGTISLPSTTSDLSTSGTGSIALTTASDISFASGSSITTVDGAITMNANQQAVQTAGSFSGIVLSNVTVLANGSGNILMNGRAGIGGTSTVGVFMDANATVRTNTGSITMSGIGGNNAGPTNNGVRVEGILESTAGGSISVTGVAGSGVSSGRGVFVLFGGTVRTTGAGDITVTGTGGPAAGPANYGVQLTSTSAVTSSGSGTITVNATAGAGAPAFIINNATNRIGFNGTNPYSGNIVINADSMDIVNAIIQTTSTATLLQKTNNHLINLGAADSAGTLGLTDAELDRITAGTLNIGNANSGAITFSGATPIDVTDGPTIATVNLVTGSAINSNSTAGVLDIVAAALNLTSVTGIGIEMNADTLTTSSANLQNLRELNAVAVGTNDINASGFTLTLSGGRFNTVTGGGDILASAVQVQSGATIGGTGAVTTGGGGINVQGGGAISPGTSPGILSTNNVSFNSTSTFDVEIGGTAAGNAATNHDQLNVTGTVSLGNATLNLSAFNSFAPTAGQTFVIINNDSTDTIPDTFAALPEGATISPFIGSSLNATITYAGGTDSNDVVLTAVEASADLSITKTDSPDPVTEGNALTYTLTVSNAGPANATNVAVTDTLPGSVTFVSATPSQGSCSGTAPVVCNLGTINNAGNATIQIVVIPNTPGSITNNASATATETDSTPATDSESTQVNAAVCTPAPSDMVLWHPADGNTFDISGNSNSGTLVGNATYAPGKVDRAYSLDGDGDYVSVADAASLRPANVSVDGWFKLTATPSAQFANIVAKALGTESVNSYAVYLDSGMLKGAICNTTDGCAVAISGITPAVGTWHHYALKFDDNANSLKLYFDGAPVATEPTAISIGYDNHALLVGADYDFETIQFFFPGLVDETEVFSRALSDMEVADIYNASFAGKCRTCTAPPADMISWWAAEGNADDLAGTNNGTGTGVTYASGKVGQAFSFDATDIVTIPDAPSLDPTGDQVTLDGWINPSANNTAFYFGRTQTSDHPYLIYFQAATPAVHIVVNSGEHSTGYVPPLNTWTHLAMVYDGTPGTGTIKLYANGVEVFSAPRSGSVAPSSLPFTIGNRVTGPTATSFTGLIDEVQVINRALSQAEVAAIVNAGNAGKCHTSTIQFSSATFSADETDATATITVTRTGAHDTSASFHYATSAGSATNGSDYDDTSDDLTFDPGEVSKTFTVTLHDDSNYEGDETVNLQLSAITGTGVSDGTPLSAVLTINDSETAPDVTIDDVSIAEGSPSGTTNFIFTVSLSTATQSGVTVNYSTADGTTNPANAGTDYTAVTDSLVIPANQSSGQITIAVSQDTTVELDETFFVNLTGISVGTITDSQGVGTIENDDTDVSVAVTGSPTVENSGTPLVYQFTRNGVIDGELTVNFSVGGTANQANDYGQTGADSFGSTSGTVMFEDGEDTVDVTITPTADSSYEPSETVILTVTSGTGYNVGSPSAATGTITDDDSIPFYLVVTKTADTDDGFCSEDDCSLREAISNANTNADASVIAFDIDATTDSGCVSGTGVCSIKPLTALPVIVNSVVIDGYSQKPCSFYPAPCSQPNTLADGDDAVLLIELSGMSAPASTDGLVITAGASGSVDGSLIEGLVINRFSGNGVKITTSGGTFTLLNEVVGNFIGTDVTGLLASDTNGTFGNGTGVFIDNTSDNMIGCTTADERNLISGNLGNGVLISGASATLNLVQGNFIGTDMNGAALGNGGHGVAISGAGQSVIGLDTSDFGNANLIAYNAGDGVSVLNGSPAGVDNVIRGNSIHSNTGMAIDLDPDGLTANDANDPDTGANNLQNFPIIRTAQVATPNVIRGTLNSTPSSTFTIDLYSNTTCNSPGGNGEGKTHLGSTTAATGGNGDALWSFNPSSLSASSIITATATDSAGNTSEFSACFTATAVAFGNIQFASANTDDTETNSGSHTLNIVVKRVDGADRAVGVTYTIANGSATTGDNDYSVTSATGTLSWANGDSSDRNITITVNGDMKFELDETVDITLSSATGGATITGTNPATLTIKNDDSEPTILINDVTQTEDNASTSDYDFTVSLSNASYQTVTVNAATADNSATTADSDYVPRSATLLTFAPNETEKHFIVQVNGDLTIEPNEQFFVTLTPPIGANATTTDQGVGTIINDDTAVSVAVSPSAAAENGATNLVYTFTRNPLTAGSITVNFSVAGTADFATDYAQSGAATFSTTSGTVVIGNGNTTATVTIDPSADGTVELDETVDLTVTSGTGYNVGTPTTASATITNDDTDISVAVAPTPIAEDDPPDQLTNPVMVYTFTRTGVTTGAITVNFSVAGTAVFPADYTQTGAASFTSSSGTVAFGDGVTTATVTIDPVTEAVYETNETVILTVASGTGYEPADTNNSATGAINNNDAKPTLSIGDRIANEGTTGPATTTNFVFNVTRTGGTEVTATVDYTTSIGSPNAATGGAACGGGVDYVTQSGSLTFLPSESTKPITILVCRDANVEANETFFVDLSNAVEATINDSQGRGTIQNDDAPGTTLIVNTTNDLDDGSCNVAHCSLRELITAVNGSPGGNAIGITFDIPFGDPRHFYYSNDGVAGQVTNDGSHVFPTSAVDDTTIVGIDPDWPHSWWSILPTSSLPGISHRVILNGYSQTGATANTLSSGNNGVLRIELSGASAGAGASGLTLQSSSTSSVSGLVINGFTAHGLDLQGGTNNTVIGNRIGTDVSGTIDLGNTLNGVNNTGSSATVGGATPAEVNIISGNNGDGISFTGTNSILVLGNLIGTRANGTSALGNGGNGISFAGAGALFNTAGGTQAGEANTIAFNGGDGVQVGSTAGQGNAISGNSIYSNGTTANHLGIDLGADGITTNDAMDVDLGPNKLQNFPVITVARVTGSTRTISGTLNSTPNSVFTIDFYQSPSCDTSGNGEGKTYVTSITTDTSDANGDVSFSFHPTPLLTVGNVLTATATSTGASSSTSEFSQCATITDGSPGAGDIQFTDATYTIGESGVTASITVKRVGGTNGSVTTTFSTSNGSAQAPGDYFAVNSFLITYVEGETANKTVTVTINEDTVFEGDETVLLSLGSTVINATTTKDGSLQVAADPHAAVLTITDNDPAPTFTIDDVTHLEGNSEATDYRFTVTKSGSTALNATVTYTTANNTASAPSDFNALTGTLMFLPGETTRQFTVVINGDTTVEPDETFVVNLSNPINATIADGVGVGTLTNDDTNVTIAVSPSSVTEDALPNLVYTFTRTGVTGNALTVNFSVAGTAQFSTDYTQTGAATFSASSGTVTFGAGNTTASVTLDPSTDSVSEADETAILAVTSGSGYNAVAGSATGTIINDDTAVTVAVAPGSVSEDGAPNLVYTFTRTGLTAGALTVNFSVAGTAAFGTDYTQTGADTFSTTSGTVTFGAGNSTAAVTVNPSSDSTAEPDETVILTVTAGAGYNVASPSAATGTILNDDAAGGIVRFSSAAYNTTENSHTVTITVERVGDTSGAATVNYATLDDSESSTVAPCTTVNGSASPRCDFTTALGTLRFAAGETSKTFVVLISQDNYVEGPEALTLTLSNLTGGAVFGTPSTAILSIDDDLTEPATNPIDDAENFVRQHYHDFLNREPDASGLAFWRDQITACGSNAGCIADRRIHVSAAFYLSIEFQDTGYLVERLYKTAYGDATGSSTIGSPHTLQVPIVRFSEFLLDTQEIGLGVIVGQPGWEAALENNRTNFLGRFVQRSRFTAEYPLSMTPAAFVDKLNTNAGNPLSPAERNQLVNDLSTMTKTRAQVVRAVAADQDLAQAEFNRAFVLMQYFGYLRRNPNVAPDSDHSGYDFWLTKLNQFNGDFVKAEMVKAFLDSLEYRKRSGQ